MRDGQAIVTSVLFTQEEQFRRDEHKENWQPFHATQFATMHLPASTGTRESGWNRGSMSGFGMRMPSARGHCASVLGLVTQADVHDTAASARGELMRYHAEAAWYPTALLPSQGVRWEGVDDASTRATLTDGTTTVTLEFRFGADGLITEVRAAFRPQSATEPAPWLCRVSGCEQRAGMHVPVQGEVKWKLPNGPAPYFPGRMTHIDYGFAGR